MAMRLTYSGSAPAGRRIRLQSSHGSKIGLRVSHQRAAGWAPPSKDAELDLEEARRASGSRGKKKKRKGRKK